MTAAFTTSAAELVRSVESYLLGGMFGDGKAVAGNAAAYYRGAARACAIACGIAPELMEPAESLHLESQRRVFVDDAFRHCMAGRIDEGTAALRDYLSLRDRAAADPLTVQDPGGATSGPIFAHAHDRHWLGDLLLQRAADTTSIDGARVGLLPVAVSTDIEAMRARAIGLACRSIPRLADDVFAGVRQVVLYSAPQPYSIYTNAAPLFVFLGQHTFERDHFAAELLMHECLHQKLNDISVVRSLFRSGYDDAESAKITVPWSFSGDKPRYFSADRTFAAFHVYSHQTALYLGMAATAVTTDEADLALENVVLSWARAAHFARAVQDEPIRAEFGPDGHRLASWLTRAVDDLGQFRLPDGSLLHSHQEAYASPETAALN